jgi:hypothetical protein
MGGTDWLDRYKSLIQGFKVAVDTDATAAARHPQLGDGHKAAVGESQLHGQRRDDD